MGCGMSTEEKEGKQRNEEIENQLKRDKMLQRNEIKMLLLGAYPFGRLPRAPCILLMPLRCW
jgi:guanine nucleotide-binding protein G(i) subunit alpha